MIHRIPAILALSATALIAGLPALAQTEPDFGGDTSIWANDGECDDPRFAGSGMATSALEANLMADATDCRNAFQEGTVQLIQGQGTASTAPDAPPAAPASDAPAAPASDAKGARVPTPVTPPEASAAAADGIDFGNDSSEWARDGECDDRRFVGQGMAASLGWVNVGRDATDCRALHETGSIRVWNWTEAQAATQCAAIDFGDDSGEYANDGECDDIRFEGLGSASGISTTTSGKDASDCVQLCAYGVIALRDY